MQPQVYDSQLKPISLLLIFFGGGGSNLKRAHGPKERQKYSLDSVSLYACIHHPHRTLLNLAFLLALVFDSSTEDIRQKCSINYVNMFYFSFFVVTNGQKQFLRLGKAW